ncbi:MAG: vanadium-dependent haloperoxidase [Bacteroidia bacterium]|nr:vanadium-dependent haloperoxidase [Bacteroidia bacterium]
MRKNYTTYHLLILFLSMLVISGCQRESDIEEYPAEEKKTEKYDASVSVRWMNLILDVTKSEGKNPPQASRIYGYSSVALYEAVVPGMPENKTLVNQLNGLYSLPKRNKKKAYDFREVANATIYSVAKHLFTNPKPSTTQKLDSLHNLIASEIQSEIPSPIFQNSLALGTGIGNGLKQWISADNFDQTRFMTYTVPSRSVNPSFWAPTDNVNAIPLEPFWGQIRTFTLQQPNMCFVPTNYPYSTDPASSFYENAMEVYNTRNNLTQEQQNIARWWADGPGATPTPPGHWMRLTGQMIRNQGMDLSEAAELYVLVGVSGADAFISCWSCKYTVNLLRPVTYIRENIDPAWNPLLATPPFPEYTSGHSVCSGAMSEALTQVLGDASFTDSSNIFLGIQPRTFSSFYEAADEAAISRLYGGIHFREAIENGVSEGRCVGQTVLGKLQLRKHD